MKLTVLCLCLFFGILAVSASPYNHYYRSPRRTPSPYRYPTNYGNYRRYRDTPVDTLDAPVPVENLDPVQLPEEQPLQEPLPLGIPLEEIPVQEPGSEAAYVPLLEAQTEAEPIVQDVQAPPKRAPKKNKKTVEDDDDEDDDQGFFPFAPKSGNRGTSNVFFPIMFGGQGRSANGAGPSTAIANSFSTGRKGSARSHATAYGNPDLEAYLRRAGKQE